MKWEDILKNYLVDTLEFIKSTKGTVVTQGQLYIDELIKWEIVSGIFWGTICLALCGVFVLVMRKIAKGDAENASEGEVAILIFSFVFSLMTLFFSAGNYYSSIKAYVAPRVVVIEKLKEAMQ